MEKQLSFKNGILNYSIKGNGPAVVLLHGFLEDLSIWNDFAEQLSKKHKVISIDLPGFGKSSVFSEKHSMDFMAITVNKVLEEEKIEKCIITGHSMGGYVGLSFASLYSEKLNGIVLFHSQAAADSADGKANRDRTIDIVNGNHSIFIHSFIPTLFAKKNVNIYPDEIENLRKVSSKTSASGITAALAGMRDRDDSLKLISSIEIPIFFVVGKQDSKIPLDVAIKQLTLPKNCEALILEEVGHMGFIEAKKITYLALEHFIERNS